MSNYETITNWFVDLQALIMSEPEYAPLRALFPVEAERMRDHALASRLHERAIQVIITTYNVEVERLMIGAIGRLQRRQLGLGLPTDVDEARAMAIAGALDEAGHAPLGSVNAPAVADMRAYLEAQMVDPGDDRPLCDLAAAKDANIAQYPMAAVVGCPHFAAIASDPTTIAAVAHHLGALPTVLGYTAWWSFAGRPEAREAQFFHFDLDDYRICKLFVYLTDVEADSGPHIYVEGTHRPAIVAQARRAWAGGEADFDAWYLQRLRKSDAEVEKVFERQTAILTGPAGTTFLADTRGIHKGLLPDRADRLVGQVLYGVTPRIQEALEPLDLGTPATAHVPDWVVGTPTLDYANRLFLRPAVLPRQGERP
ncbi:MAG: hypothetical protein QF830_09865 [Rhodospirillales bacterium]|jgi:hypothetical protein|nr:hypothetical protein [Rhodospirillales bacterium]MDP6884430.1 hypothetical protein [Rhodospirillales bacterium]